MFAGGEMRGTKGKNGKRVRRASLNALSRPLAPSSRLANTCMRNDYVCKEEGLPVIVAVVSRFPSKLSAKVFRSTRTPNGDRGLSR